MDYKNMSTISGGIKWPINIEINTGSKRIDINFGIIQHRAHIF